jgi:hypothetical protein
MENKENKNPKILQDACAHDEPEEMCSDHSKHYDETFVPQERSSPGVALVQELARNNVDMVMVAQVDDGNMCSCCGSDQACNLQFVQENANTIYVKDAKGQQFCVFTNAVIAFTSRN